MKTKSKEQIKQQRLQQRLRSLEVLMEEASKRILEGEEDFVIGDGFREMYIRCGSELPLRGLDKKFGNIKGMREVIDRLLLCPIPRHKTDKELMECIARLVAVGWEKEWKEIQEARVKLEYDKKQMEKDIFNRIKVATNEVMRGRK